MRENQRKWPVTLATAAALTLLLIGIGEVPKAAAETCPPDDPGACLVRCRLHKAECLVGCRARKQQCIEGVRAEVHACKLGCRLESAGDPVAASACKRRCVAAGLTKAREVCRRGKPACIRLCHPEGCGVLCGLRDDAPVTDAPRDGEAPVCKPPVDRECLGVCGEQLRDCARRVRGAAEECLEGCRDLAGWDRYRCVRDCADDALGAGLECKKQFRGCVTECGVAVEPEPDGEPLVEDPADLR